MTSAAAPPGPDPGPGPEPDLGPPTVLRAAPLRATVDEWSLVLSSAAIPWRVERADGAHYVLVVPAAAVDPATRVLEAWEREAREAARDDEPDAPDRGTSIVGLATAAALAVWFAWTGGRDGGDPRGAFEAGTAASHLIAAGQWWRAVTALTLHGDAMHLFGNVVACLLFVGAVGRWLGAGPAFALVWLSGVGGNLLTAAYHHLRHHVHLSVGASTATFGALGILAGLQFMRRRDFRRWKKRAWLSFGAGLALFAMLGVGEQSDIAAHLFGLATGAGLGVAAARATRAPAPWLNVVLMLAFAGATVGAWSLAFAR